MAATIKPLTGAVVATMLGYEPGARVTFTYAGRGLTVERFALTEAHPLAGLEFTLTPEGGTAGETAYVVGPTFEGGRHTDHGKPYAVVAWNREVLGEGTTLEVALGVALALFEAG